MTWRSRRPVLAAEVEIVDNGRESRAPMRFMATRVSPGTPGAAQHGSGCWILVSPVLDAPTWTAEQVTRVARDLDVSAALSWLASRWSAERPVRYSFAPLETAEHPRAAGPEHPGDACLCCGRPIGEQEGECREPQSAACLDAYVAALPCTCVDGDPATGECMPCGVRDCPHDEPLHWDKDGCPACNGAFGDDPAGQ